MADDDGVLTDEAMKEMAEQLKTKYDEIMESTEKLKEQNINLKKDLLTLYAMLRITDNILDDAYGDDNGPIKMLVEIGRSIASSMLDHHIFNG